MELHAVGDERWSVLLAPWIMSFGCLRYAHIARSEPRRLTAAFLHCRCPKGKQKHARDGFDFAVPATFANGFFWAKEVLEAYRTLAPARQRLAGLCFSDEGRPWTILEVQETMQQEMSVFLDNPEDLTTYSWRRLAPTVAQLLDCRPEEMAALGEPSGMVLACDCPMEHLCEADMLIGLFFDATAPGGDPMQRGTDGRWSRTVALLQGIQAIPKGVALPMMSQEALVLAFQKLFPEQWFKNYKFAMVEDLINSPPFCSYAAWLAERGEAWDGPLVPHLAAGSVRQLARIGDGCQVGAMTHRAALPPLLPFNLDPDDHFNQALQRAQQPLPYEDLPVVDLDLEFVADAYAAHGQPLRPWRQHAVGAMRELKRRWEGVTLHLRPFQEPAIQQVTRHRDVGFIALLMLLTSWADTSFPYGLIRGLPAVGYAPPYGVFPQQPAEVISMSDVLDGWQEHNQHILNQLRAGKDDEFLLQQSLEDAANGFCTAPLRRPDFLRFIGNKAHRLIPRCVITQSSGKQRVIDNGDTGGQSALSSDANKLTLCSPLRPAQHIRLAMHRWTEEEISDFFARDAWETGQEDLPSPYRYCPMALQESLGCVVVWYHHEWQTPAYQVYAGLLFGLPLAVTSFNRFSRLLEALARPFAEF